MVTVPLPPSHHSKDKQAKAAWAREARAALSCLQKPTAITLELVLDFYAPWFGDDGKLVYKMPDCKNLLWELEDLVADALGYNDTRHWRVVLNKRQSSNPRCEVWLRPLGVYSPGF